MQARDRAACTRMSAVYRGRTRRSLAGWIAAGGCALAFTCAASSDSTGGPYVLASHAIAGGGGRAVGDGVVLEGSIGQSDAGAPQVGGGYSLTGGFQRAQSARGDPVFGDGFE